MPTMTPGRRDGHTIAFLTDMHAGTTPQTKFMHARMGIDLDWLERYCKVIGLAGDNVNWGKLSPSEEDAAIKAFISSRRNKKKYLLTSGNHDLGSSQKSYGFPSRSGNTWAAATAVPKYSHYPPGETVSSGLQVVALSQESMKFSEWLNKKAADADGRSEVRPGRGVVFSSAAFDYLRARLDTGRPTILMIHYPLVQHVTNDRHWNLDSASELTDIITQYDNFVGVISGHYHRSMNSKLLSNRTRVVGNGVTKWVAGINGPSAGAASSAYPQYTDIPLIASVVSYKPGKVIVRWRDVGQRRWVRGTLPDGKQGFFSEINVSCQVPVTL